MIISVLTLTADNLVIMYIGLEALALTNIYIYQYGIGPNKARKLFSYLFNYFCITAATGLSLLRFLIMYFLANYSLEGKSNKDRLNMSWLLDTGTGNIQLILFFILSFKLRLGRGMFWVKDIYKNRSDRGLTFSLIFSKSFNVLFLCKRVYGILLLDISS